MAQERGSYLDRVPAEILLIIIGSEEMRFVWSCGDRECQVKILSPRDLISLARTSRRYYEIASFTAYKRHVAEEKGLAIYWAIKNDQYGMLQRLVENGVDVNMRDENVHFGAPLEIGESFHVHDLVRTKAFVRLRREARFSPLAWAASHGKDSMVEYLLDHGADMEQMSGNLCRCQSAELLRCPETFPEPLEFYSRDPHDDDDDDDDRYVCDFQLEQWKPLYYALCNGKESTARLLIERGANANRIGEIHGVTALHIATRWELDDTIDYMLDKGCVNINEDGLHGTTALHMAQVAERDDLVDKYLGHGADINSQFTWLSGPWTIFIMACLAGDYGRAREYLSRGANPHLVFKHHAEEFPWTVMRIIYGLSSIANGNPRTAMYERMKLESEIIASCRRSLADTRKSSV